jgi:hypothetical protein
MILFDNTYSYEKTNDEIYKNKNIDIYDDIIYKNNLQTIDEINSDILKNKKININIIKDKIKKYINIIDYANILVIGEILGNIFVNFDVDNDPYIYIFTNKKKNINDIVNNKNIKKNKYCYKYNNILIYNNGPYNFYKIINSIYNINNQMGLFDKKVYISTNLIIKIMDLNKKIYLIDPKYNTSIFNKHTHIECENNNNIYSYMYELDYENMINTYSVDIKENKIYLLEYIILLYFNKYNNNNKKIGDIFNKFIYFLCDDSIKILRHPIILYNICIYIYTSKKNKDIFNDIIENKLEKICNYDVNKLSNNIINKNILNKQNIYLNKEKCKELFDTIIKIINTEILEYYIGIDDDNNFDDYICYIGTNYNREYIINKMIINNSNKIFEYMFNNELLSVLEYYKYIFMTETLDYISKNNITINMNIIENIIEDIVVKSKYISLYFLLLIDNDNMIMNKKFNNNNNILHIANNINIVKVILNFDINIINLKNDDNDTPMFLINEIDILWEIIKHKIDYNVKNKHGKSLLHIFCEKNFIDIIEYIMDNIIHLIDDKDNDENTPIMIAAKNKNEKLVELLIEKNANKNICDIYGNYIYHYFCKYNMFMYSEIINYENIFGYKPIDYCTIKNTYWKIIEPIKNKN